MAEEDLIFGKNRHLFGGIEPSNMLKFNAAVDNGIVKLTVTLPNDTVVNGQTLCTVDGAIIRRKATNYPEDEFDGDLVADIKASTIFADSDASSTGTYYYAAFPYTAQGVYNRNKANRAVVNEPEPMVTFKAKSVYTQSTDTVKVNITAAMPNGIVGAVIRKSTIGYPINETDGELFQDITSGGVYADTNVTADKIYYYTAFPYTSTGAYNRSKTNRTSVTPRKRVYLFGYDLEEATPSPSDRVSYPSDVDNADFTPAAMNFETGKFNYGGWDLTPGEYFMPRPCMLTYDGVVDHYLDPNDYTKQADGSDSKVADASFGGNAMMEWPKIYTKRWSENGIYHFRCSDVPQGNDWDCWCNYDRNDHQIDHFYTSIYVGSEGTSSLRSISGTDASVNGTAVWEITQAKNNGDGWYTEVLADRLLIQDLLVMLGKSTNCRAVFGEGVSATTNVSTTQNGTMDNKGLFWGVESGKPGIKVFGMENFYGLVNRRIAGWFNDNGIQKIKITRGTHDGSEPADYSTGATGYIAVPNATPSGSTTGYISAMRTTVWGRIPYLSNGSSTTFETDTMCYKNNKTIYAAAGDGGVFSVDLTMEPNEHYMFMGTALSCKPLAAS